MADDYAAGGLVPRPGPVPAEQWTSMRMINPPQAMPDGIDEWVATFVASSASPVRTYPAPAPTGSEELDAMVRYLRDMWSEERCVASGASDGGAWKMGTAGWRIWVEDSQERKVAVLPTRLPDDGDAFVGEHIERQEPREVLADLDAKEQLLSFLRPTELYGHAVRILLQRYSTRPDFPEAWRLPAPMKGTS
ncbi:DUF6221 family protein (plasmid) [Streptomyces hirsutus]|uniref:DUF6221 family protein n=1 Tax=Streptomyces hirsutus TaxID=35620 RepID=UPI0038632C60|nr:DUF6221 family protein [Streptomyces hirsutus]